MNPNSVSKKIWIPGWTPILRGYSLIWNHKNLWKFCWLPVLITALAVIPAVYWWADTFDLIRSFLPDTMPTAPEMTDSKLSILWKTAWYWALLALSFILDLILGFVLILIELIFLYGFLKVISSPFNDVLSEHIEKIDAGESEIGIQAPPIFRSLYLTALTEAQRFFVLILSFSLFYLCSLLVPVIGPIIFLIFSTIYACFWFAYDAMSYCMDRRDQKLKSRVKLMLSRPLESIGFGGMIYLILLIPGLNFFLIPLFVSGGTILYRKIESESNSSTHDKIKKNAIEPNSELNPELPSTPDALD